MTKNKQLVVKGKKGKSMGAVRPRGVGLIEESVYERSIVNLQASGVSLIGSAVTQIDPVGLIAGARLAGYQVIRDDARIDHVRVTLEPLYSGTSSGRTALYIERDAAATISATYLLADSQFERRCGSLVDKLVLDWFPQQPADFAFQPLSPGNLSLGYFAAVGDSLTSNATLIPASATVYSAIVETWMTLRGRPS
jgi:hypothetical protein